MTAAALSQSAFRGRTDALGVDATPTWIAAINTNFSWPLGRPFRIRFLIQDTTSGAPIAAMTVKIQANKNAGAFQDVTASSTIVRAYTLASSSADETALTVAQLAGTGTFANGVYNNTGQTSTGVTMAGSGNTEYEFGVVLDAASLVVGDVIIIKTVVVVGTTITATTSPSITASTLSGKRPPPVFASYVPETQWVGTPRFAYALQTVQTYGMPSAPFYAPNPPFEPPWRGPTAKKPPVVVQNPFARQFWQSERLHPEPEWVGKSTAARSLQILSYKPRIAKQWLEDHVPPPDWTWKAPPSLTLTMLARKPFATWHPRYDFVAEPYWSWSPPPAPQPVAITKPPAYMWREDVVPDPVWTWEAPPSLTLTMLVTGGEPFSKQWRYDYRADDISLWQGVPEPAPFWLLGGQVPTKFWRWDYHIEQPIWSWTAPPSPALINSGVKPFAKFWREDIVPNPDWTWEAPPSLTLTMLAFKPRIAKLWRYDYHIEQPVWSWNPPGSNTLDTLHGKPFTRLWRQWRADIEPPIGWAWSAPYSIALGATLVVSAPTGKARIIAPVPEPPPTVNWWWTMNKTIYLPPETQELHYRHFFATMGLMGAFHHK